ncbi:MAG: vWA domain-containing protein, partial [Candidatus Poribacteria bacterium]
IILHIVIVLILGLFIMGSEQRKIKESVAVDMITALKNKEISIPRRIVENRDSTIRLERKSDKITITQFKPRELAISKTQMLISKTPDAINLNPIIGTDVNLKPSFEMNIPKAPTSVGSTIARPGSGIGKTKIKSGGMPIRVMDGAGILEVALYWIAKNIIGKNKTGREDIVFLIDSSGSMEENIAAVARYIYKMLDVFKDSKLDYTLGIVRFKRILKTNDIKVFDQTKDANQFKAILRSIKCSDGENIFDAIDVGFAQVKFRGNSDKAFILVTDEAFTPKSRDDQPQKVLSRKERIQADLQEVIATAKDNGIKINVIALDDIMHKALAKETDGVWFPIPQQSQ